MKFGKILNFFENGLSSIEVAIKYVTTRAAVDYNAKKYGIIHHRRYETKYKITLKFLIENLKTKSQIQLAKELGCNPSLISYSLKKLKGVY